MRNRKLILEERTNDQFISKMHDKVLCCYLLLDVFSTHEEPLLAIEEELGDLTLFLV